MNQQNKELHAAEEQLQTKNAKRGRRREKNAEERLTIEITRYKPFIDIVSDINRMARVALLITLVTCLVFIGLLVITLTVKRVYPYNDIRTNAVGATTIKDEKKDVIYWLFNTSELWANSGIYVKEGDILNIRASGLSHTAIHHLVQDAELNRELREPWSGTAGIDYKLSPKDLLRAGWRIIPNRPHDALVMQVIPASESSARGKLIGTDYLTADNPGLPERKNDIYYIGKERTELHINTEGYMHFAVNDIVLTQKVIYGMMLDNAEKMAEKADSVNGTARAKAIKALREQFERENTRPEGEYKELIEELKNRAELKDIYGRYNGECYSFGPSGESGENEWTDNEMTFYSRKGYSHAWFDDNVGSFLIVIERRNNDK